MPYNWRVESVCNASAIRRASRRLAQLYDDALEPCGLRSTQYSILVELERQGAEPPTMRELADALVLDRSALGHALRPLERDGLIELSGSDDDRRRRHVTLTSAGSTKLRAARRLWQVAQDRFESVVGKNASAQLRKTLLSIAHDERLASLQG
jgi:DNA-binding MarR family transcriptional regulator